MPKVIPEIFNGHRRLVLSESFILAAREGMALEIPIAPPAGTATRLRISFAFEIDDGPPRYNMKGDHFAAHITLHNFLRGPAGGFTKPLDFNLGDTHFLLYCSQSSFGVPDHCTFTATLYEVLK
jgi:hypothetical protein